jgi:hypothetical protein
VDKHRLLLTIVATMDKWGVDLAAGIKLWFDEHSRFVPLVVGKEITNLPTSTYERQSHQDFQLGLDVAFGEAEIPEGELVLYTLNKMVNFIGAYSGDVNGRFQRDVNGHSGHVNKVGAQRRWDYNHARHLRD